MKDEIIGYACPICDTPNPKTATYCVKCGHWLFDTYSSYEAKPITRKGLMGYFGKGNKPDSKSSAKNGKGFSTGKGFLIFIAGIAVWVAIATHSPQSAQVLSSYPIEQKGLVNIQPANPEVVTPAKDEYGQVKIGMTIQQVTDIFGKPGKLVTQNFSEQSVGGPQHIEGYVWVGSDGANVAVIFLNDKAYSKQK